jgi:glyoxylate reductase
MAVLVPPDLCRHLVTQQPVRASEGSIIMPSKRLSVTVTRRLPDAVETRMRELFDVKLRDDDTPMTPADLVAAMQTCDVLVPTVTDDINAKVIGQAGDRLKLIASYGAGVDHIDVQTARQRGILVSNTPGVVTDDTADMTMALILAVTRRIPEGLALMQSGDWNGWAPTAMMGGRIAGRRLGILGMGRIGQAVARRARAFGMQVHYNNRRRLRPEVEDQLDATWWESLDQMVARMDIISVNCPHTPATFHLMNARRLKLMKKDAVIVNTARGGVIDENALTRMLRSGDIAGAGLDVYENGTDVNPRLRELKNVVLLPHMGSATLEGRIEMGEKVLLNIKTFQDGHRPPDLVVPAML